MQTDQLEHVCTLSIGNFEPDDHPLAISRAALKTLAHFLFHERIDQKRLLFFTPGPAEWSASLASAFGIQADFRELPLTAGRDHIAREILSANGYGRIIAAHFADRMDDLPELLIEHMGKIIPTITKKQPAGNGYRLSIIDRVIREFKYGQASDPVPILLVSAGTDAERQSAIPAAGIDEALKFIAPFYFQAASVVSSRALREVSSAERDLADHVRRRMSSPIVDSESLCGESEFPMLWRNEGPRMSGIFKKCVEWKRPTVVILPAESFINFPARVLQDHMPAEGRRVLGQFSCQAPLGKSLFLLYAPGRLAYREFEAVL